MSPKIKVVRRCSIDPLVREKKASTLKDNKALIQNYANRLNGYAGKPYIKEGWVETRIKETMRAENCDIYAAAESFKRKVRRQYLDEKAKREARAEKNKQ